MTNETVINNGEDQVTTAIGLRRGKGLGGGEGVVGRCAGTMVEAVVVAFKADSRASQYRTLSTLECKYWCRSYCSGVAHYQVYQPTKYYYSHNLERTYCKSQYCLNC